MNSAIRFGARALVRLLPKLAYPVLCGPLRGSRFILGSLSGEAGGASVYINRIEPEQSSALVNTLRNGQVFFDIGANVGYYTLLAARLVGAKGRVFAFEPVVRNIAYLYRHILLNGAGNVTIVPAACSDAISLETFSAGRNFSEGHLGEDKESYSRDPVPTVSVDEVARRAGVWPHVIKIDVEGGELSVLKGAQATLHKARPRIFLSTHSDILRTACLGYLKECGYASEALSRDKTNPTEFLSAYAAA